MTSTQRTDVRQGAFFTVSAAFFVVATAVTITWSLSSQDMAGMSTATMMTIMMAVMMVAMMMPVLTPMLRRYRLTLASAGQTRLGVPTLAAGLGYFLVWTALVVATSALGAALMALEMRVMWLAGVVQVVGVGVVAIAGLVQFTRWKAHHLACCRTLSGSPSLTVSGVGAAWRHGVRMGIHCASASAGLMAILVVVGMMSVPVMALVTGAIVAERLAPNGERVAHIIGGIVLALSIALAIGL
jgi:predicted metal-binding membrane protein